MSDFSFIIRNYRPGDFNNYFLLHAETEQFDRSGRYISTQALEEDLGKPNYYPETNLFVAEAEKKIIGYISLFPEQKIGRALLNCMVHPLYRRKGVAQRMFSFAVSRTKEMGIKAIQIDIPKTNVTARSLLSRSGFKFIRRFLELKLDFYNIRMPDVKHSAFKNRRLRPGEENKLTEIQNLSFIGTWGYNPNTTEEIIYRINMSDCSPEDVIVAYKEDKFVGYCWTTINTEENIAKGEKKGKVHMMGVDPDYQNRGIGKQILLAGLNHLLNKGIETVELTADNENQAALSLYESIGFKVWSETLWYEKICIK